MSLTIVSNFLRDGIPMRLDWANASNVELSWSVPAVIAFLVTLLMIVWTWRSFAAIRSGVQRFPAVYRSWGPRWNFSLLLLGAMICFGIGWLGYLGVGVVAMMTPPPVAEANQEAAAWLAWLLIGMEATHAIAQVLLWAALRSLAGELLFPKLTP
jgi:hypothetical protein